MAGSPLTAEALLSAWMCPFNDPPTIKGDHRLLGLDFDPDILFGATTAALATNEQRGTHSRQPQTVTKYCKRVITKCTQQQIAERIDHLLTLPLFGPAQYQELEDINTQLTHILTKADRECHPKSNAPWSPALNQAYIDLKMQQSRYEGGPPTPLRTHYTSTRR